jgi:hypothetical protein
MKKIAFAVVIAVVAASPALAAKKKAAAPAQPDVVALNDNGYRFVHDSMPIYWPSALTALYYTSGAANANTAATTTRHKKKR